MSQTLIDLGHIGATQPCRQQPRHVPNARTSMTVEGQPQVNQPSMRSARTLLSRRAALFPASETSMRLFSEVLEDLTAEVTVTHPPRMYLAPEPGRRNQVIMITVSRILLLRSHRINSSICDRYNAHIERVLEIFLFVYPALQSWSLGYTAFVPMVKTGLFGRTPPLFEGRPPLLLSRFSADLSASSSFSFDDAFRFPFGVFLENEGPFVSTPRCSPSSLASSVFVTTSGTMPLQVQLPVGDWTPALDLGFVPRQHPRRAYI